VYRTVQALAVEVIRARTAGRRCEPELSRSDSARQRSILVSPHLDELCDQVWGRALQPGVRRIGRSHSNLSLSIHVGRASIDADVGLVLVIARSARRWSSPSW